MEREQWCSVFGRPVMLQDGPDHVDARPQHHLCHCRWQIVEGDFIDHTMYSTTSVLRTIGLILGFKPMSQYDAKAATPIGGAAPNTPGSHCLLMQSLCSNDINEKECGRKYAWQRKE